MTFATDNVINPVQSVVPGVVPQSEGTIPPPPGFETAAVPNNTPSFDVITTPKQETLDSNDDSAGTVNATGIVEGFTDTENEETAQIAEVDMREEIHTETEVSQPVEVGAVSEVQKHEATSEKQTNRISTNTRVFSRRVDQPDAEFNIGRPKNPSLNYAIELFFKTPTAEGGRDNVEEMLPINGEIIQRTGEYGLWEEGGATANEARAILATNPDGSKPIPFFVFTRQSMVNSKHALVPITIGSYIVIGGRKNDESIILVYRVDSILEPTGSFTNHRYDSQLVAYHAFNKASSDAGAFACFAEEGTDEHNQWVFDHPALKAMRERLQTIHASVPAYVSDYREHRFDSVDFNDCLTDNEFISKGIMEKTLEDAYAHAGDILGELTAAGVKKEEHPHLVVSLSYNPDMDAIAVFCMAKIYNMNNKSSRGQRLYYSRTILTPGSSFYYPDKTANNAVSFDRIKEILTKAGGAMATSFRRMTVKS